MTQQIIDVGNVANDGQGDPLRTAFIKINENFTEVYNTGGLTGITNGSSNIQIVQDSNINMSSANVANVFVVTGTGTNTTGTSAVTGNASATGNVVAGGFFVGNGSLLTGVVSSAPAALITGTTLSSNVINSSLTTVGTLTALGVTGNITGGNITTAGRVSAAGNVVAQNFTTGGTISATGDVTGANVSATGAVTAGGAITAVGNITGNYFIGNGSLLTGFSVSSNAALLTGTTLSSNVTVSSLQTVGTLNYLVVNSDLGGNGAITANSVSIIGGPMSASGNVTGGNLITVGALSAASGTFTGDITGGNITGNLTGGNIAAGNINATNSVTGTVVSASGNITGGNVNFGAGQISGSGNITGGNLIGTVATASQPSITSVGTLTSLVVSGNVSGGNVSTGIITATGNVTGSNVITTGYVTASGNVTGGNVNTGGIVTATGNVNTAGGVSATGNITSGNLITGGSISASGSLSVAGSTIIAGNLTVNGTTEYTNVTTLAIADPIIGIGRGANNAPLGSNDGKDRGEQLYYYDTQERSAFIGYLASTGKLVAATRTSITNEVVTVNTFGTFVVGQLEGSTISVTGTVTGGNLLTSGSASATGNITGGNVITAGSVSAGGLVISGNTATVTTANYTIGYRDIPQLTSFGTLATTDGGKHYYGSGTLTIPTNGSVALPIGTSILVVATNSTTIANATGVTLTWAGPGTGGTRTLAQYGMATLVKVDTNTWYINGTGLS